MTNEQRATIYHKLAIPSLIYAFCFGFILRGHLSGIGMILFAISTVIYCGYCMKAFTVKRKVGTYIYMLFLLLIGISTSMTGSQTIHNMNRILFFVILLCMQLHIYYDDRGWTPTKFFLAFFHSQAGCFECVGDYFGDRHQYRQVNKGKKNSKLSYIVIGLCISVPLLAILIALLSSADAVFSTVIKDVIGIKLRFGRIILNLLVTVLVGFFSYAGIKFHVKRKISDKVADMRSIEATIGNTVLSLVSVVYVLFSAIQILYLFMGNGALPKNYSYAEYAREGFFQLLAVCVLNIALVLFCVGLFRESKLMKILLTIISLCTYIMLASSAFRMIMYIKQYHLTFLRIFVLWFLGMLAFALVGLICSIYSRKFRLFRYLIIVCSACYLLFSFSKPDYWIARHNIAAIPAATEEVDLEYLSSLSSDAAPVIAKYDEAWTRDYREQLYEDEDKSILSYNFSIRKAWKLFPKTDSL